MAELYAKPFEIIDTGYNPQQPQGGGQSSEADEYLSSLPPEERQAAMQRLNAPLTGEELATLAQSGQKQPSLAEFAEIEKFHKNHEISFIDGLGKIAEGGEQFMTDISKAFGAMLDNPSDVASKMPATAVEAFAQGTRNFYGMLAQSNNTDSTLFKVKDFLNGTGTIEDRYNQYIQALKFNKDSMELMEGKQTMVMDADMINHEVTQAMAYIADPSLFIPFGKVASTGLRAVGLGEKLAMAGARSAAIKNGIIGNTLKWGVGQPLEFLGGAVRNTIDFGLEKAGAALETTTGIGAKEFAQTARMSGIGFSASAVAGYSIPFASTVSDAYIVGSSARGFGEAITLVGETMKKNKFGRGINSWAAEALEQAEKSGTVLSPHAKGLLKTLNAVDPLFAYGWNGLETAAEGGLIGGGLGYLSGGQEGMYSGIGAGIAMGAVGGTAGKMVADVTGGTNVARRAVQAKMVIEGHKVTNPDKAMFFQAMQTAAEARGKDVDLVNGIIAGIDKVAPNFEFHALTPDQFYAEAKRKGYDPTTGKFKEISALDSEFGGDRASKSRAMSLLRSLGGEFAGNRKAFEDVIKNNKKFTPDEIKQLTDDAFLHGRARLILSRFGFINPKGKKTDWGTIMLEKKYIDSTLKGLTPEQIEAVKKHYESVTGYDAQQKFIKDYDVKTQELKDISDGNGRKPSKYNSVSDSFNKLTKTQQEAVLKEIDGQGELAKELGGATKLRDHYDTLTWAEGWTDQLVKKFETDREGSRKDITEMLAQETGKDGKLNRKGRALADKLRAEGFLDRDNKLLRERNLLQADLTISQFAFSKGAVIGRESDGKTHMYINLNSMGNETFPHELFHTIMRESPMKKYFTDSLISKLLGTVDKDGNLVRPAEVNIGQVQKFFKKYIDLTHRNDDGTLDVQASEAKFKLVQEALTEYQNAGSNKKISDKARGLLEHYSEEFGAYYFSHWLMGRNRNTLFFGGELKGIEGLVERTKDSFKDFWQSKVSKSNPEFDFSNGLNEAFDRSKGLGRIASVDYYMRDMVRAASNANREAFRPDSMTLDNLRDFERSNGLRNLTTPDGNRRLNPREQVTQNIRLGKEAFKILSGVDRAMRTSKDVIDENGKQVITGRLSETELDALVKGGIVPRAWADKVNQGYAMLDGTISNVFSAGYLGKTEQTTDASYPRLTGRDVAFKNRKAVLFDVETKVKADGTFYTLFHTLDLAVIEQEANRLFQNTDYRALFDGDRAVMEADFFRYLSNASRASTDPKKLDSAALLEKGDGLGAQRRDVLHQMGRMALQTGDAYKHQPIAVIPEGFRHSVTTFNIDGMTTPRVETGTRVDIDMKNAHKFIRENWQPDEMKQEKTPTGVVMTHETGFKFTKDASGRVSAYTDDGSKVGTFGSIKEATTASKNLYNKAQDNIRKIAQVAKQKEVESRKNLQPLDEAFYEEAFRIGDMFKTKRMQEIVGNSKLVRQTFDEFLGQKVEEINSGKNEQEKGAILAKLFNSEFKELIDLEAELRKTYDEFNLQRDSLDAQEKEIVGKLVELSQEKKRLQQFSDPDARVDVGILEMYGNIYKRKEEVNKRLSEIANKMHNEGINDLNSHYYITKRFLEKFNETGKLSEEAISFAMKPQLIKAYEANFETGKAVTFLANHGTPNHELMVSKTFNTEFLGRNTGSMSAFNATFFAGSKETSVNYVGNPIKMSWVRDFIDARSFYIKNLPIDVRVKIERALQSDTSKGVVQKTNLLQENLHTEFPNDFKLEKTTRTNKDGENIFRPSPITEQGGYISNLVDRILEGAQDEGVSFGGYEMAWKEEGRTPYLLRNIVKMDNPLVHEYAKADYRDETFASVIKRAKEAGHDGVIFKNTKDGGGLDTIFASFAKNEDNKIFTLETSEDTRFVPRGNDEAGNKIKNGSEIEGRNYQPTDEAEGGRVYDFNSPKFKSSFIGKYAEENPERLQNKNIEFVKRRDGSYRITMTDNSGATKKIGHITADLDMSVKGEGIAVISSNIDKKFRGNKLANVLYSEMAERLRAMGVKYVDGTIVNPEGIPVQVRNSVIGQTYYKGSNKPALREDAAKKIQAVQSIYPSKGIDVYNELDFNARYQPTEDWSTQRAIKARENQPRELWTYPNTENFKKWAGKLKFIGNEEDANKAVNYDKGFVTTVFKGVDKRTFDKFSERPEVIKTADFYDTPVVNDPNFFVADEAAASEYAGKDTDISQYNKDAQKAVSLGVPDMYYIKSNKPANLLSAHKLQLKNPKLYEVVKQFWDKKIKDTSKSFPSPQANFDSFLVEIAMGRWLKPEGRDYDASDWNWRATQWQNFHKHLLKNGYDSIVMFDNSVSKKAPSISISQETANVKGSSNYGEFSRKNTRYNFQPSDYQGGDDYFKPKKNKFESKDEEGLLIRRSVIRDDDLPNGMEYNPEFVTWFDIGHYGKAITSAEKKIEIKNSGLWYWKDDKGIKTKNPYAEMDRPDFTHDEWFNSSFKYQDDMPGIYGRYEKPQYDNKGNLIKRGKISLTNTYRSPITDMADAHFYKEAIANSLKSSVDDFDAYWFGATPSAKREMGLSPKDQLPIKFQPTEGEQGGDIISDLSLDKLIAKAKKVKDEFAGNKKYTKDQMENKFIGRYARENPSLVKGLKIEVSIRPPSFSKIQKTGEGQDNFFIHIKRGNESIGTFTARQFGTVEASAIESNVSKEFQGQGYGKLMYSEMAERLRFSGVKEWYGRIEDQLERPIAIRQEIVDKQNYRLKRTGFTKVERNPVDEDGFKSSEVTTPLFKEAYYQPDEGRKYNKGQMDNQFIGRQASKRRDLTDGIRLAYRGWDKQDGKDEGRKSIKLIRTADGNEIGRIDFDYDHLTNHGIKSRGFGNGDKGGIVIDGINVRVHDAFQGMGYQHILYSEMFERARAIGAVGFSQSIENKKGLPLKSVNRVIGEADNFIASLSEPNAQKPTQENFDRLMAGAPAPTGKWGSNEPAVQNWGKLDKKAWYQPDESKIGTQSSNVKLLLEGMRSGRILRTASYKGLGLEDANLIAHTPDTAKIGQVTAGDKALADLQGGIFYAIANGKKIWASNFAGEGETNILVQFAKDQLQQNANGKTYIMLVKADNSKIFASVDGARGVSNIFKHLNDSGVMTDLRYNRALKNSAEMHLRMKGLDGLSKDELYARIDDALLRSKENKISFENRADFTREIARQLNEAGAFDSKKSKDALVKSFHKGFERGFSIVEMERVFGNLMAEDIIKDVPKGHVYGAIEITNPLRETKESDHRGYDASIEQESGEPSKLIMFDRTAHVTEIVNKKSGDEISMFKAGEGAYHSYTGGQIPYQEVRGKKQMPFQPTEYSEFKSEQSATGRILRNAKGYVIMLANNKFRVYNPAKAIIGVYGNEEEAKKRIYKEIPKR